MKKHNFYLTDQQIAALRKVAQETGLSVSEHIRRAIDEYLKREG